MQVTPILNWSKKWMRKKILKADVHYLWIHNWSWNVGPYLRQLSTIFQTILHLDIEQICTWREGISDDINGHTFHTSPKECALKIDSAIFKKEVKPKYQ